MDECETDTQRKVVLIWSEVLKVESIGIDDDFFEVGGNSMYAAIVTYKLRDEFSAEFPLMLIFENPTVRELAQAIAEFDEAEAE